MTEAAIHTLLKVEVIERVDEMLPVEVRIDSEHLAEYDLADFKEIGWEAAALANPVTWASKLGKGRRERCRACGNRTVGAWSVKSAGCISCAGNLRAAIIVGKGDSSRIRREDVGVIDLA